jgi:hypothetical protein
LDPLDPLSKLLSALHRSRAGGVRGPTAPARTENSEFAQAAAAHRPAPATLEQRLRARLAQSKDRSPQHLGRLFVDTVLVGELGDSLAADPAFAALKDDIAAQLLGDPELNADLSALVQQLSEHP